MSSDPVETADLAGQPGIVRVVPDMVQGRVQIDYDPQQLSEDDVRELIVQHHEQVSTALEKSIFRLKGSACEACAIKLEHRISKIPGVHHASASYMGKALAVTFEPAQDNESTLFDKLRQVGADIRPFELTRDLKKIPLFQNLRSGELNEEISCGLGLLFLIAGWLVGKVVDHRSFSLALYLGAYVFAGQQGVRAAIASLRERVLDVDVLMVLAAFGAAIIGAPFEGALLLFLFSFSNVLQRHAMERTQRAIESLLTLRPHEALVKRDGSTVKVAVESLGIGETVVVRPGEQIPVDGVISEGNTHVDESSLTGESMPVSKGLGSAIFAGTLNQSGGIEITVTKRADDSTLARMVKLVAEAQAEKSTTQRFLEKAEQYYAMGVIALTALVLLIPYLSGEAFGQAFYRAMTIMVVASPCALIISTPATVLSAIGGAARRGILIKGGSHLERAARIDIVAVDKTGTLTVGKPSLTDILTADGAHEMAGGLPDHVGNLLRVSAAVESRSEHPLANAIVRKAKELGVQVPQASGFQSTAGKGAEATVESRRYLIGSERLFQDMNASDREPLAKLSRIYQTMGRTCVWLGSHEDDGIHALAVLVLADTLRPAARNLITELHALGVKKVVMLTGDQQPVAESIARESGVDEVFAGLLPEDKVKVIRELKQQGRVMMVGDGVNDAPALAVSDLGVAMGAAGTDVAMESADVVLMGDRLENIPLLLAHARRTRRVLMQNLFFASTVIVVLVCAALGFALALPLGVVGHEGSTVIVCLSGLRLLMIRDPFMDPH